MSSTSLSSSSSLPVTSSAPPPPYISPSSSPPPAYTPSSSPPPTISSSRSASPLEESRHPLIIRPASRSPSPSLHLKQFIATPPIEALQRERNNWKTRAITAENAHTNLQKYALDNEIQHQAVIKKLSAEKNEQIKKLRDENDSYKMILRLVCGIAMILWIGAQAIPSAISPGRLS